MTCSSCCRCCAGSRAALTASPALERGELSLRITFAHVGDAQLVTRLTNRAILAFISVLGLRVIVGVTHDTG
jgi:hypothetical protein